MIKLTLPIPPSLNQLYRGVKYKTTVAKNYTKTVQEECLVNGITDPTDKPVKLSMRMYPPAYRGDADNYQKILFDALQGFAYNKDRQIQEFHVYRMPVDKINPRIEIEIEVIE